MNLSGGSFSNLRWNSRQISNAPATWCWVFWVVAIQALVVVMGGENRQPGWFWFTTLGLSLEGILSGKIWQLVSYGLLHGGWWHCGLNAAFLLLMGSRIEHIVGRACVSIAVLLGVLGGGLAHLGLATGGADPPLLVGISGGCFSLLLLMVTLSPQSRMMPLPVSGQNLGRGILLSSLFLTLVNPALGIPGLSSLGRELVIYGMSSLFQMGHACHFGGGVTGWLIGRWLLRPRVSLAGLRRERNRREGNLPGS